MSFCLRLLRCDPNRSCVDVFGDLCPRTTLHVSVWIGVERENDENDEVLGARVREGGEGVLPRHGPFTDPSRPFGS